MGIADLGLVVPLLASAALPHPAVRCFNPTPAMGQELLSSWVADMPYKGNPSLILAYQDVLSFTLRGSSCCSASSRADPAAEAAEKGTGSYKASWDTRLGTKLGQAAHTRHGAEPQGSILSHPRITREPHSCVPLVLRQNGKGICVVDLGCSWEKSSFLWF